MPIQFQKLAFALASVVTITLAGCGGSNDGGASIPTPTTAQPSYMTGTAATGAALGNASVAITDSSGKSPCVEATITTTALGNYSCTLIAGEVAPFFVVVTDPTGNIPPMVSVQTTTPAAGQSLTVNVTPLTTAIVAQLSVDGNALSVVSSKTIDAVALKKVTDNVVAQLTTVLTSIGAPAGYNPFTTNITAATSAGTGNTADLVLEIVRVVTDPSTGSPALSTISNPTPIVMATASTPGAAVAAPPANVATLTQGTQLVAKTLNACFAIATSQRVLTTNTNIALADGGPEVQSTASVCQNLAWYQMPADLTKPNFLHNGYSDGQFFYSVLTDDKMTGAQFSVPEILSFTPASTSTSFDSAVLNIKYVDANGNPGNIVVVASRYTGTSTTSRPTDWWLTGNQIPVDVTVRMNIRRVAQLNAASTNTNRMSTFMTGLQFRINYIGPGSTLGGNLLAFARVSGPGLPGNGAAGTGLVYIRSQTAYSSNMDVLNKTGTLPAPGVTNYGCNGTKTNPSFDCPNFWLQRTAGITGNNATTLTANPVSSTWAQPNDLSDPTQFVKGQKYTVELFYGSNTEKADLVISKTLTSDLVQATLAVNLPWNSTGPATASALDPNGSLTGQQVNSLPIDWIQNLAAQQISYVSAVIDNNGTYGLSIAVPKGATSIVLTNEIVPAFSTTAGNRNVLMNYRMMDTSNKTTVYRYN